MIEKSTQDKIVENLKLLTLQNKIDWKHEQGVFFCDYLEDRYEISPVAFIINDNLIGATAWDKTLQGFYTFLNDLIIGQTVLGKLDKACSDTFLKGE